MPKERTLKGAERERLIDELYHRYADTGSRKMRFTYLRKKYSWLLVITGAKCLKRLLDITLSLLLFILTLPFMLCIAFLIKVTDFGPILYISKRVGKRGREFYFPKFRSMKVGADLLQEKYLQEEETGSEKRFKHKKDPRVTWIGRIIRRTSLDELPQLWCVLKGEMSLVGPRPPTTSEVDHYTLEERRRLEIKPGLTCIWQVSGRSDIPFEKQVKLDIQYIESQSLFLDLFLLLKTIPAVVFGKGAY